MEAIKRKAKARVSHKQNLVKLSVLAGGREAIVNLDPKAANELATKLMLHAAHATVEHGRTT